MSDLEDLVPPHEPAEDAITFAGRAALSLIPAIGALASETLAYALEARQVQRQHEFNVQIARALTETMRRIDSAAILEDVVGSDDFIAGVTRAQRAAAETASASKRQRLAAAVANGGGWAPFSASERAQFVRLVEDFEELHVWLLHYFQNPTEWLQARGLYEQHSRISSGGIDGPLGAALGMRQSVWRESVTQAVADLDRAGLASIPLTTMMSRNGIFQPRTSPKGERFLEFINESDHVAAEPPASI
ncbi:hypothetical protein NQ156_00100 [Microbacterium sp. zg.Y625]|uniref:hypothetical protein n=1 Tax=Microbacterium jiangjiandongii TaxID=3049071 RepID=UPI00214AA4B0|nr:MULTISPECIES: hypothetical protein [unclassified Microbacterium]MCR2791462.1 hypothetical protein [Microbacterium sp. zg.Y625]WIM24298.1 hypothetical protein QNO14_09020 [Microbacterium sp. zg-Y625]